MRRIFSTLISIALVSGALNLAHADANAAMNAGLPRAQARAARIRLVPRQIKEANRKLRYTITVKFPQAVGHDPRFQRLNRAIRSMVTEQIAGFKKDFEAPEERTGPTGSSFDISYSVELANDDLVSIIFYIDSYYEGAAHPNHVTDAFNYSFATEKTMTLAELFKSNDYLNAISRYTIKDLKKKFGADADTDWIEKGAGPALENYRSWNITRKGLKITFDPYQVASYAEGEHIVVIPYSALKSMINPDGPLAKLAR